MASPPGVVTFHDYSTAQLTLGPGLGLIPTPGLRVFNHPQCAPGHTLGLDLEPVPVLGAARLL